MIFVSGFIIREGPVVQLGKLSLCALCADSFRLQPSGNQYRFQAV